MEKRPTSGSMMISRFKGAQRGLKACVHLAPIKKEQNKAQLKKERKKKNLHFPVETLKKI